MSRKLVAFLVVFVLGLTLDQASKAAVRRVEALDGAGWEVIPGLLRLVHTENAGAALSWFTFLPTLVYVGMSVGSTILVMVWLWRLRPSAWVQPLCLGLVLSGALGNTIDRALYGTVTDFIILGEGLPPVLWGLSWFGVQNVPAFNVADALLGGGLVLLGTAILLHRPKPPQTADQAA